MAENESKNYKVFDDGTIHLANNGVRLCTGKLDLHEKFDGDYEYYQLCQKCQSKKPH